MKKTCWVIWGFWEILNFLIFLHIFAQYQYFDISTDIKYWYLSSRYQYLYINSNATCLCLDGDPLIIKHHCQLGIWWTNSLLQISTFLIRLRDLSRYKNFVTWDSHISIKRVLGWRVENQPTLVLICYFHKIISYLQVRTSFVFNVGMNFKTKTLQIVISIYSQKVGSL